MIVPDASALVELLLQSKIGARFGERIAQEQVSLHVPVLVDLEVLQTLRKLLKAGALSAARAEEAFNDFRAMRLVRHDPVELLDRVWSLRDNLTAYDAAYVALAESLDAPLVTLDVKVKRAPKHQARVEVLR